MFSGTRNLKPGTRIQASGLELAAKNSSLTADFLDTDFYGSDGCREFLPDFASNLSGDVFSQQFRTRIRDRQKNHVPPGQNESLFFVEDLDLFRSLANLNRRAVGLDQSPMVQSITDPLDQRLEGNKVQHDTSAVQFT